MAQGWYVIILQFYGDRKIVKMKTIPLRACFIMIATPLLAAGCIQGSASATLDVNGTYKIVTQPVALACNETLTGAAFNIAPIPSMEMNVDVNQGDGGIITLASQEFNWNLINLRMDPAAATQPGTTMTGTINEDGTFFAEVRDSWVNAGSAGPLQVHQQMRGKFTQTGVEGTYLVDLVLKSYNNSACRGSSGFTGEKLKK